MTHFLLKNLLNNYVHSLVIRGLFFNHIAILSPLCVSVIHPFWLYHMIEKELTSERIKWVFFDKIKTIITPFIFDYPFGKLTDGCFEKSTKSTLHIVAMVIFPQIATNKEEYNEGTIPPTARI